MESITPPQGPKLHGMYRKLAEFKENKPEDFKRLNECSKCQRKAARYMRKDTGETIGIFLLNDGNNAKICNLCKGTNRA